MAELPDAQRIAWRIVVGQAGLTAVLAILCWLLAGFVAGRSALIGGGIGTVANLALTLVAFRRRESDPGRFMRAFFVGEAAKFGVVVVLFALVFVVWKVELKPATLLGTYVATFLVYWVVLARALRGSGGGK